MIESRRGGLPAGYALLLLLAVACSPTAPSVVTTPSAEPTSAPTRTLTGTFTLEQDEPTEHEHVSPPEHCRGTGGYDDIRDGTEVVVSDESGTVIGTGALEVDPRWSAGNPNQDRFCKFVFEVDDLPDADFYTVEVGDRGDLTYPAEELAEMDWELTLSIGD